MSYAKRTVRKPPNERGDALSRLQEEYDYSAPINKAPYQKKKQDREYFQREKRDFVKALAIIGCLVLAIVNVTLFNRLAVVEQQGAELTQVANEYKSLVNDRRALNAQYEAQNAAFADQLYKMQAATAVFEKTMNK